MMVNNFTYSVCKLSKYFEDKMIDWYNSFVSLNIFLFTLKMTDLAKKRYVKNYCYIVY